MTNQLFESALGITAPWYVQAVDFDAAQRQLTIAVDFVAGTRFSYAGVAGEHPVYDTQIKCLRHLNFFQHECFLEVRVPRVRLPDGSVRLVEPDWVGHLNGFTLLFEALVLMLAQQMPFAAVRWKWRAAVEHVGGYEGGVGAGETGAACRGDPAGDGGAVGGASG